jgi:hypothetical protein
MEMLGARWLYWQGSQQKVIPLSKRDDNLRRYNNQAKDVTSGKRCCSRLVEVVLPGVPMHRHGLKPDEEAFHVVQLIYLMDSKFLVKLPFASLQPQIGEPSGVSILGRL